jgi:FMN phosphatase YigB (HAD superfamily)
MTPMIHSFDVFDTCLTRKFAAPSDLFLELGRRLQRRLPALLAHFDADTLRVARQEAENDARARLALEEVPFDEVWRDFAGRMGVQELREHSAIELELEEESLRPIVRCRREIERLRAEGSRILFISDTYFPRAFVETQLQRHGFFREEDGVYVSSQWGKAKATGHLFQLVLETEKIPAAGLQHQGDHAQSDVAIPRALGIKCSHVPFFSTPLEVRLIEPDGDDYGLRSRLAGAMRVHRLQQEPDASDKAVGSIAGLLGPLLLGFASWVLAQARRDGVRRLYFVARDCQLTYHVAQEISGQFGQIDCRYLYVSRQALLLPTIESISPEGMPWLRRSFEAARLDRLLAKLELTYADVREEWDARAGKEGGRYKLQGKEDWQRFWASLNREPLRGRLRARVAERRATAQAYFREEGLFDQTPWAIVDLGWFLSCQSALRRLLRAADSKIECRGYYLGLHRQRAAPSEAGLATGLFNQRGVDHPMEARKQTLFLHTGLFDHALGMADHPSVHHYEATGSGARPAFQHGGQPAPMASGMQAQMRAFARENAGLALELGEHRAALNVLSSLIDSIGRNPSAEFARALALVQASDDQNNIAASSLAAPITVSEVVNMWTPYLIRKGIGRSLVSSAWMAGRLATTPAYLRALLFLREAIAARFHPTSARP